MSEKIAPERANLTHAKRLVVKVGTRVLTQQSGRPNIRRIQSLVKVLASLHNRGLEIVLVTSGAVGMGVQALKLKARPSLLPELQMSASVGQAKLMAQYAKLFADEGIVCGQVLLTHDDLRNRTRHLNARNTILCQLRNRVIPIINENDVVAVDEIKMGDNDVLAALVTILVEADILMLLTTVDGFRKPLASGRVVRVSHLTSISPGELERVSGRGSVLSSGGMRTKLEAAFTAVRGGACAVIADGRKPSCIDRILSGKDVGTLVGRSDKIGGTLEQRKQWIAFFHRPQGVLVVDDGARRALEVRGKSLLPIGITEVRGDFPEGSLVTVESKRGEIIARGLVSYNSKEIRKIMRRRSSEITLILGGKHYGEVIHRDNMVVTKLEAGSNK